MSGPAGRNCPIGYRYGPQALRKAAEQRAGTLYVIGGLYGNLPALETVLEMARCETGPVTLCFNGDFNWFNVDDDGFAAINHRVLAHDAVLGNVEAELLATNDDAGCGCAYPDGVDADVVERSNAIHRRLKATASRHPEILKRLRQLPMLRRYRVGGQVVGVVHGDAESLAGWRFDVAALDQAANRAWLLYAFARSGVDIFASSHTCLPAQRRYVFGEYDQMVINNGAAGMPNFGGDTRGLITRISACPSPHEPAYGARIGGIHVDALGVAYDHARWTDAFLANWPVASPAYISYSDRIAYGPDFSIDIAANAPVAAVTPLSGAH